MWFRLTVSPIYDTTTSVSFRSRRLGFHLELEWGVYPWQRWPQPICRHTLTSRAVADQSSESRSSKCRSRALWREACYRPGICDLGGSGGLTWPRDLGDCLISWRLMSALFTSIVGVPAAAYRCDGGLVGTLASGALVGVLRAWLQRQGE